VSSDRERAAQECGGGGAGTRPDFSVQVLDAQERCSHAGHAGAHTKAAHAKPIRQTGFGRSPPGARAEFCEVQFQLDLSHGQPPRAVLQSNDAVVAFPFCERQPETVVVEIAGLAETTVERPAGPRCRRQTGNSQAYTAEPSSIRVRRVDPTALRCAGSGRRPHSSTPPGEQQVALAVVTAL